MAILCCQVERCLLFFVGFQYHILELFSNHYAKGCTLLITLPLLREKDGRDMSDNTYTYVYVRT